MTLSRSAVSTPSELQPPSSDLVIPNSYRNTQGPMEEILQHALATSVEAKVEARVSELLEGMGLAFYALDQDWRFTYINQAAEAYFRTPRQEMLGRVIWDVFPQSAGTDLRRRYEEIALTKIPSSFEADAVGVPGCYLEFHVFPYSGGLGISFRDWTKRQRAEAELRESEARLSSIADNLPNCMVYQLLDEGAFEDRRYTYVSKACERLTGVPAEDVKTNSGLLYDLLLPGYREEMLVKGFEAHRDRTPFYMEFQMVHAKTGEVRWHRLTVTPRPLPNGTYIWDGLQLDITDHKRAEEHLRLLVNELNHRVKNTLATVQSLAVQSFHRADLRHNDELVAARSAFEARLFALARGHDVLTRENWESASIAEVVGQACAPYRSHPDDTKRIETEGPDLRVPPPMALSLSMALHELFTNALKYGSLGSSTGQVLISWSRIAASAGPRLILRWEESGGPPVAPPARKGFGSRLIQDGLARELNGVVHLQYEPTGVVCTMDVPLS